MSPFGLAVMEILNFFSISLLMGHPVYNLVTKKIYIQKQIKDKQMLLLTKLYENEVLEKNYVL